MIILLEWLKYSLVHEGSQCQNALIHRVLSSQLLLCSITLLASATGRTETQVVALHLLTYFALPGGQSRICSAQQAEQPEQKESSAIS